jgi:Zn-dependent peptidase ImmA (M78 family)
VEGVVLLPEEDTRQVVVNGSVQVVTEAQARHRVLALVHQLRQTLGLSASVAYTGPTDAVAAHLGVVVKEEQLPHAEGCYIPSDPPVIVIDPRVSDADRKSFTFFHELMHHLVRKDDLLYSFIAEYAPDDRSFGAFLESVCNAGAAEFLIPSSEVRKAIDSDGFSMRLVETLESSHSASKPAIAIQLAQCASHRCFVVVCGLGIPPQGSQSQAAYLATPRREPQLFVQYASSSPSARYRIARYAIVPDDHVIALSHRAREPLRDVGPILFRGGNRRWKVECEAFYFKGKVYAAFNVTAPTDPSQPRLF